MSPKTIAQRLREKGAQVASELRLASKSTKQAEVLEFIRSRFGRAPVAESKDPIQRRLGRRFNGWIQKYSTSYDPTFEPRARKLGWSSRTEKRACAQAEALEFLKKHGRAPSTISKDRNERKLGGGFEQWIDSNSPSHDPTFELHARKYGWLSRAEKRACAQAEALEFLKKHGRAPSTISKDRNERKLGNMFVSWLVKSGNMHDPTFEPRARSLGWLSKSEKTKKQQAEALAFFKSHGRRPSRTSEDPHERRLAASFNRWTKNPIFAREALPIRA